MMKSNIRIDELQVHAISKNYINGINDPTVRKFLMLPADKVLTRRDLKEFVESNIKDPNGRLYGIWDVEVNLHIGNIRIHDINQSNKSAYLGICLFDTNYWGLGIAADAIQKVINYVKKDLNISFLKAGVEKENQQSIKLFVKLGFINNRVITDNDDQHKTIIEFMKYI